MTITNYKLPSQRKTRANIFRDTLERITQPNNKTFPMVTYYVNELSSIEDKKISETSFKLSPRIGKDENGRSILMVNGAKIADGGYIYVLLDDDALHLSRIHSNMHHSHLATFQPVKYAGEMSIEDGQIKDINLESGHYKVPRVMELSLLKQKFADLFMDTETTLQKNDLRNFRERFKALSLSDPEELLRTQKLSIPDDSCSGNEAKRAGDPVFGDPILRDVDYPFDDKISGLEYKFKNIPSSFSQETIQKEINNIIAFEPYYRNKLAESSLPLKNEQIRQIAYRDGYAIQCLASSSRPMSDEIINFLYETGEKNQFSEVAMNELESAFFKSSREYTPERLQKFCKTNDPDSLGELIASDIYLKLSDEQKDMLSKKFVEQIFREPDRYNIEILLKKNIPLSDEQKKDLINIIIEKADKGEFGYQDLLDNHVTSSNFPLSDEQYAKILKNTVNLH